MLGLAAATPATAGKAALLTPLASLSIPRVDFSVQKCERFLPSPPAPHTDSPCRSGCARLRGPGGAAGFVLQGSCIAAALHTAAPWTPAEACPPWGSVSRRPRSRQAPRPGPRHAGLGSPGPVALTTEEPGGRSDVLGACTCHTVINGWGIAFDRNSMAWNRLCASLLCLRQSAY